jgi:hypothetical protein
VAAAWSVHRGRGYFSCPPRDQSSSVVRLQRPLALASWQALTAEVTTACDVGNLPSCCVCLYLYGRTTSVITISVGLNQRVLANRLLLQGPPTRDQFELAWGHSCSTGPSDSLRGQQGRRVLPNASEWRNHQDLAVCGRLHRLLVPRSVQRLPPLGSKLLQKCKATQCCIMPSTWNSLETPGGLPQCMRMLAHLGKSRTLVL